MSLQDSARWVETAVVAVALLAITGAAVAGAAEPTRLVNTLDDSAADIEAFFATLAAVERPETVEVVCVRAAGQGKWPEHLPDGPAVRLTEDDAREVSVTLLSIDSYRRAMSACPFSPEVAFRFHADGETVTAFVSFDCSTVLFEDRSGRPLSGRLSLGHGRRPLLAVAKAALPADRKVQALTE